MTAAAIELRDVTVRRGARAVVRGVSFAVRPGETLVLIGPSGCGKTTTLKTVNRLVEPDEGTVSVGGVDVRTRDPAELRRGIGYVIQDVGLFPHYTVRDNVALVPRLLAWPDARVRERVDALLAMVALPPGEYGARYPRQLSGGQRQRVGIARALAADPPVVLLDEPFGALDPITRERMQAEFAALARALGKTFVLVTHDVFEAARLGDRVGVMRDGALVQLATPRELVRRPADDFVAQLLGRHRYQLALVTARVGEVLAAGAGRAEAPASECVDASEGDAVWDALERMAAARAAFARVATESGGATYLTRTDLVEGADG